MSSGSIHPHSPRERLHSGRETWLSTVERPFALSKMQSWSRNTKKSIQKKSKKLAKLKAWKGDLGNRERPDGLKTRKGGPGKIRGIKKGTYSRWIENPKGRSRQKLGIFSKSNKTKKAWLLRRSNGETACVSLQIATSSKLLVNNGLYPQETSVATWYQVLPRLQFGLFTITSSPRKFAECLYCNVTPPPILPVLSHFIEFIRHVQLYSRAVLYNLYSHTDHIHSYIHTITHSYINTFTHQRIHNITWYQFLHGCISHPSLVWSYPFSSVLTYHCVERISCNRYLSFCAKRIACNYLFVTFVPS